MSHNSLQSSPPARQQLAPAGEGRLVYAALVRWHLLSLDAPTVAAVWMVFFATTAGVSLVWSDPLAMFLAVWLLYVADRLLDAKPLFAEPLLPELEHRHLFHHKHRSLFLRAIALGPVPLAICLHRMEPAVLHLYVLLVCLLLGWLLLVHGRPAPSAQSQRLPKELAVGLFFPAAVLVPTVARLSVIQWPLGLAAVCFGSVCMLNCLSLHRWEHPRPEASVHATTRWGARHLPCFALVSGLLPACLLLASLWPGSPLAAVSRLWAPLLSCSLSSFLLLRLHQLRRVAGPLALRALADFVLLTPLPFLLVLAVRHHG